LGSSDAEGRGGGGHKTGNLRAVQLLLGHTKLESTVRYLGIEVDDALNMAEQIEL
jgi:site-specific recombinase XerC